MSGVLVVLIAVACDPSLLFCVDIATPRFAWQSVAACKRDAGDIQRDLEATRPEADVVMTKCRLYLPEPSHEHRFAFRPAPSEAPLF